MDSFDRNKKEDRLRIGQAVLDNEMKYGDYPKALIDFHVYASGVATPIDEHIYEAKRYLDNDREKIHFTIAKKMKMLLFKQLKSHVRSIKICRLTILSKRRARIL